MSVLRPYLKSNEVAIDRDVLGGWMNKLHRVGLTLDKAQDALPIRDEMKLILGQPRWTEEQTPGGAAWEMAEREKRKRACDMCDDLFDPDLLESIDLCPACSKKWWEEEDDTREDTLEGDAALDELARHEATIAVPVAMLREWREIIDNNTDPFDDYAVDSLIVRDAIAALLSTFVEKGPGTESE